MNPADAYTDTFPPSTSPEEITAKSKSNFSLSFWFLPKNKRRGITNFYALSRVIDDAVDDHPPEEAVKLLEFWKQEVNACYDGEPRHPVTQAMQQTIREFEIPKKYLDLLLEGCTWDIQKHRYETYEDLTQYCYRVAGTIGLISMKIFGLTGPKAEQAAEELGLALQLTNILRDIPADAGLGRIYLPQEDLKRYRITEAELLAGEITPKIHLLLKLQADRAQTYFDRAFTRMKQLPHKPLIAAWIMGRVYYELLRKIRGRHFDVFSKKISVSKFRKLLIAFAEFKNRNS